MEPAAVEIRRTHHSRWRKGTETTEREGLVNMDWTDRHSDCKAGRDNKSKLEAERSREKVRESVCYNLFRTRNVDYIAGELGDVHRLNGASVWRTMAERNGKGLR